MSKTPWYETDPLYLDESPVEALGLRESVTAKLIHAGLFTIHDLMSYLVAWRRNLTDLQGIGPQTAAKIADALAERRTKL